MDGDPIRVNGNQLSWGSLIAKVDGERVNGFTALNYEQTRERTHTYGMGGHHAPRGRTRGKYTPGPVTMTGHKTSVQALKQFLANKGGTTSYGDTEFDIVLQGVESDETPITVEISSCVITGINASHEEGTDPMQEEITIQCMAIRENGLTLFDSSEPTPN